jgi:hypothetical protein
VVNRYICWGFPFLPLLSLSSFLFLHRSFEFVFWVQRACRIKCEIDIIPGLWYPLMTTLIETWNLGRCGYPVHQALYEWLVGVMGLWMCGGALVWGSGG